MVSSTVVLKTDVRRIYMQFNESGSAAAAGRAERVSCLLSGCNQKNLHHAAKQDIMQMYSIRLKQWMNGLQQLPPQNSEGKVPRR
jgi:hypothetical protein